AGSRLRPGRTARPRESCCILSWSAGEIRMSSSIFNSRFLSRAKSPATFLIVFLFLYAPHEAFVRRSEALYGRKPLLRTPSSDNMKVEWFFDELTAEREFSMYFSGSSVCEYALEPDLLADSMPAGVNARKAYNLGFSGTSALAGLEILETLN